MGGMKKPADILASVLSAGPARRLDAPGRRLALGFGIAFSLCTVLGAQLYAHGMVFAPGITPASIAYLMAWAGALACGYALLAAQLLGVLEGIAARQPSHANAPASLALPTIRRTIILLACWAPYLLCSLPGSVHGDYIVQLMQHLGIRELTNHHPILITWLYGALYDAGRLLGDANLSVLVTVVFQAVLLAASLAFAVTALEQAGTPRRMARLATVAFALIPVLPMFAFDCIKDTPACACLVLLVTQMLVRESAVRRGEEPAWWASLPALGAVGLLASLLRNNFVFCIVPAVALLRHRPEDAGWWGAPATALAVFAAFALWGRLAIPLLGAQPGSIREAMSVPIQQVAYCYVSDPKSIEPDEAERIQAIMKTEIERLPELYTWKLADPVKQEFDLDSPGNLASFLKVWARIGLRHPGAYANSFLHGNFGYWYPYLQFTDIKWASPLSVSPEEYIPGVAPDVGELMAIHSWHPGLRASLRDAVATLGSAFPLTLLFEPAFYIWLALLLGARILQRSGSASLLVLAGVLFLTCCAGPDFSNMRYALPFIPMAVLAAAACTTRGRATG